MSNLIKPKRLKPGDTIGIVAPCLVTTPEKMEPGLRGLEQLGFLIKRAPNLYSDTNGYAGSVEERAADFNAMLADTDVDAIMFGGGEVGNELLPYIDYALQRIEYGRTVAVAANDLGILAQKIIIDIRQ